MNDSFQWWLIILGIAIGIGLAWLVIGRLDRSDDDVTDAERSAEAAWISRSITAYGGVAPAPLVEEILDLHRQYLCGPAIEVREGPESEEMDASIPADEEIRTR